MWFLSLHYIRKYMMLSRECMFLSSLSHHNKDLERQTLKPSACHSSQVLGKPCCSSQANQCYSSILFRRQQESERERERKKRAHARGRESPSESALLLLLYVFSSTWACPVQIGVSQECCLFCLKSSLWSSDLPLTFLVFQPSPFWTPFPYSTYLTFPPQEMGGPILWEQGRPGLSGYFLLKVLLNFPGQDNEEIKRINSYFQLRRTFSLQNIPRIQPFPKANTLQVGAEPSDILFLLSPGKFVSFITFHNRQMGYVIFRRKDPSA